MWDKEKILSLHEELNLRPSDSALRCSTTEPQRLQGGEARRGAARRGEVCYEVENSSYILKHFEDMNRYLICYYRLDCVIVIWNKFSCIRNKDVYGS